MNWLQRNSGGAHLSAGVPTFLSVDVQTTTMDAFGDQPDLIKIDVEGAEFAVLKGGQETLKTARAVVVELHNIQDAEVIAFLRDSGFQIRYLSHRHILAVHPDEALPAVSCQLSL